MALQRGFAAAICWLLLLPAAAASAAAWLPAVTVQPVAAGPAGTGGVQTASNANGAQAIVWQDYLALDTGVQCINTEVVSRAPGGAFSAPTQLRCDAVVAVGPNDEVVAVSPGISELYASTAPAGQPLPDGVTVTSPGQAIYSPVIRFAPSGRPTIAWAEERPTAPALTVKTATRQDDGSWSVSGELGYAASGNPVPDLAFGPSGDALLVFDSPDSTNLYLRTLYRPSDSADWGSPHAVFGPVAIGNATLPGLPHVRFDPQGRATVFAPVTTSVPASQTELMTWTRAADGSWGPEKTVPNSVNTDAARMRAPFADMEFDSQGNGVVAFLYGYNSPTEMNVRVATRAPGSTDWSSGLAEFAPAPFSSVPSTPDVAIDANDNATVAFSVSQTMYVYSRAAGSTGFSDQSLPPGISGSNPTIITDANGYTIATWTDANGITSSSVYDPVAPTIDNVVAPADAIAGTSVSFTVNGSDAWGPVAYAIDFGDGQPSATGRLGHSGGFFGAPTRATAGGTVTHTYAQTGAYTARMTLTDAASNSATTTRTVNVGTSPAAPNGPAGPPPVGGLPDPVVGKLVNLATVKPVVRVKEPGAKRFVALATPKQVRVGSIVDARRGRVRITIADGRGHFYTADFYQGVFKILQLTKPGSFAVLQLFGGRFKGCPRAPKPVLFARKRQSKTRSVRHLWGSGSGSFRTVGRFGSASVRGTTWLTDDRCNGTLVRVTAGKVAVRDFVRRKTVLLKAPKRYFARPR